MDAHAHLRNSKTGLAQTQAECVAAILPMKRRMLAEQHHTTYHLLYLR
ncbi:hypothetical protein VCHC46B1_1473 [Vibrio cholerae HC-46B1]|nr:hypothetical protein VCHC43B1_1484 [Vibrio cholerae HC-43B1]EKL02867.1 hypothetical protein VCHC41B1_1984 [Vibrio cholerae HC-41B1]EKL97455.1 hypothetical protein VCHC46B1_1473 [Vibrio cholerae HC-46B1]